MKTQLPTADPGFAGAGCRLPVEKRKNVRRIFQIANRQSEIVNGFTLVELLVVISVIAVLAGFIFAGLPAVKKSQYISHTRAEMGQLRAAIDSYHDAYGFYPPDNPTNALVNQLYYELEGTSNNAAGNFQVLDNPNDQLTPALVSSAFGVAGFVNCSKVGANEESRPARNFLHELKPNQTTSFATASGNVTLLVTSVGGVDATYQPLGISGVNPWRYKSSGTLTNNPGAYELWTQLVIGNRTNLISNWSTMVQINSPLP